MLWPGAPLYKSPSQPSPPSPPPAAQPAPLPTPQPLLPPAALPPLTAPAIEPQAPAAPVIERGWDPFNSPAIPVAAAVSGELFPHSSLALPGLMLGSAHALSQPLLPQPALSQPVLQQAALAQPAAVASAAADDSDVSDLLEVSR